MLKKCLLPLSIMMCFCLSAFAQRTALTYESTKLEDAALLIQEKNTSLKIADNNEILLNKATPRSSTQQVKQITGLVKDSKGEPLPGATVIEKGTTNGTTTDLNGNFALSVAPNAVLEISYIGYGTKNVSVVGKTNFIIELEEETNTLDEVVIIGYGAIKKADVAGAVSVLDNKNFKDQPVTQISDIFQGRVSGVQVDNSSVPGGSVRIRIRGASSINRSNDPLYVIDGIVRESGLTGLNPDDIESLQILKDASSTAIYGSRGSNGVVLITTKMGKSNKKFISIDSNVTLSSVYKRYSVLSPYEYATAYREIKNPNAFTDQEMEAYKNGTAGIDWQDEIFRNAFTKNYKISISSGNQDTQYYISANHMSQEGITIGNSNERYQIRLNLNSDITNWLQVTTDFNASRNLRKGGGFGAHKGNPIWVALNYSPTMEIMNEQGNYNRDPYNYQGINPLGVLETNKSENLNYIVNGKVDLKFKISPNLTFTTTNGVDYYNTKGYSFESKRVSVSSSMSNADNYRFLLQTSNNLTYNLQLDKHSFTLTGVGEYSTSESRGMKFSGANLLTESVGWWDVNMATSHTLGNGYSKWALISGVGRAIYNYDNRYILTGTIRADGSSKFSKKKWGYFPSVAFAWNLGNESFMENQKIFNDFKLRASYGIVGNQAIDPYSTLGLMSQTNYSFGDLNNFTGYWASNLATPELTWEKTKQFDIGVDFSVFDGLFSVSLDYFNKKTVDGLLRKQIPGYLGGGSYWINSGEISNKGVDASVTANLVRKENFMWSSSITGTYLKNEVISLGGDQFLYGSTPANGIVGPVTIIQPGHPIGSFYGYTWLGLDANGNNMYQDTNGNGVIDSGDRTILGKSNPDLTIGWNNSLTWKNWSLNAFFNSSFGAKRLNLVRFGMATMVGDSRFITLRDAYFQGFDKIGASAEYASLTSRNNTNRGESTQWLESADFVRLENISLSYNLSKEVIRFADILLSISAQNLFTITKYSGMDPAGSTFSSSNVDVNGGIDIGAYPTPRSFTFGIKLNF